MPAGIVPTTSIQPSFASVSPGAISRSCSERKMPRTIRTQSCQKNPSSTSAVARCVATRNARKKLSFWWMSQPSSPGRITEWPRLEIGKSSEKPWSSPSTMAWKYEISAATDDHDSRCFVHRRRVALRVAVGRPPTMPCVRSASPTTPAPWRPSPAAKRAAPCGADQRSSGRRAAAPARAPSLERRGRAPSIAARRSASIVSCGNPASCSASSRARSTCWPGGTTSFTSPIRCASSASTGAAGEDQLERAAHPDRRAAGAGCRRRSAARPSGARRSRRSSPRRRSAGRTRAPARSRPPGTSRRPRRSSASTA